MTTLTAPAVCAGVVAVIWVSLITVNATGVLSKVTNVAPVKPVPVMVTAVPPATGPEGGDMLPNVGAAAVLRLNSTRTDMHMRTQRIIIRTQLPNPRRPATTPIAAHNQNIRCTGSVTYR
jgi:hypothetical protein